MVLNQWLGDTAYGSRGYLMALRGGVREVPGSLAGLWDRKEQAYLVVEGKGVPEELKENFVVIGLDFLIMTSRTQEVKGKIDKWNCFRLGCFGTEKKKGEKTTYELDFFLPCV